MSKRLESSANYAIIFVCFLLGVTLVRNYWLLPVSPSRPAGVQVGDRVGLPGVDWAASRKTLLFALQTTCHYCTESAPFYGRLAETMAARPGIHLIAVFPQPVEAARKYLSQNRVDIRDVRQARPSVLRVAGTPTVMIVGSSGRVERVWFGKISAGDEEVLLSMN